MGRLRNRWPGLWLLALAWALPGVAGGQEAHVERGEASWYGPGFEGQPTASGERFDSGELTAAHPTLPLGSEAHVTNLENGRSVEVEINDRGPAVDGRVIDLSRAAAEKLDMVEDGTAPVKVVVPAENGRRE
ncbi:septal ring lytic transglycosylase RlpA family protein [Geminicoccaceae bacterium 1502E]|nr:septal ring lytic transglycosylase RlpA family protein [Geminicoccaceae bacterium 1502E]